MARGSYGIRLASGVCALGLALLWGGNVKAAAQRANEDEPTPLKLEVRRPVTTSEIEGGVIRALVQPPRGVTEKQREIVRNHAGVKAASPAAASGGVAFYPGDLIYNGGQVVTSLESHNIYVNCVASCFGNPGTFLTRLGNSNFIHVTDQYVGTDANQRYTVGQAGRITYPVSGPLGPNDIVTLVHAAASALGTGYGHIHHIFFAPGIDVCADNALTVCYSPDNFATFFFCAFHSSIDFSDIGHVLFSVEPFANVNGCQVNQPSPNGPVVDSQANVLSHELFESITDPDGTAWWNSYALGLFGQEIGDECAQAFFSYANTSISGHSYEVQPEYSNQAHACVFRPSE